MGVHPCTSTLLFAACLCSLFQLCFVLSWFLFFCLFSCLIVSVQMWVLRRTEDGFLGGGSVSVACVVSAEVVWLSFEEEI